MKTPRHPRSARAGINMTPMIDIVFLLVIFFLVSSHLVRQENQIELSLPVAASGEEDPMTEAPRVTISIRDDGALWIAGRPTAPGGLADRLKRLRQERGEGLEVRIRAGRQLPYSAAEPVMRACTAAGVWNVTWAVYREEPRR